MPDIDINEMRIGGKKEDFKMEVLLKRQKKEISDLKELDFDTYLTLANTCHTATH